MTPPFQTGASGERLAEANAINVSLTSLGQVRYVWISLLQFIICQVFTALRTNSLHVPYRNSKLTYMLQDSLGGDAKTMIFLNVSPLEYNVRETVSTLQFGQVQRTLNLY